MYHVGKCKPPEGGDASLVIRTDALEKKDTPKVKKRKESVAIEGISRKYLHLLPSLYHGTNELIYLDP